MSRLERLVNLTAFLLNASRPQSADEIREKVPGYEATSTMAFRRMLERDKSALREMGVPLAVVALPEGGEGYRIPPEEYRLEDPGFTPEERAALELARTLVRLEGGGIGPDDPKFAALKLGLVGAGNEAPVVAQVELDSEVLPELFRAVTERREVSFSYVNAEGKESSRRLRPYELFNRRGRWYLEGFDTDIEEDRLFRVDRIQGEVEVGEPGVFERPQGRTRLIGENPWEMGDEETEVSIRFGPEAAWMAQRIFGAGEKAPDGSITIEVKAARTEPLLDLVVSFGESAEILSPESLRDAILDKVSVWL